jgi:hypothetical protein
VDLLEIGLSVVDWIGLAQVERSCERGNEPSGPIKYNLWPLVCGPRFALMRLHAMFCPLNIYQKLNIVSGPFRDRTECCGLDWSGSGGELL